MQSRIEDNFGKIPTQCHMPSSHNHSVTALLILFLNKFKKFPILAHRKGVHQIFPFPICLCMPLVFFITKHSSLLTCDDKREQPTVKENAKSLYHVQNIPCDTYLRSTIDLVPTKHIRPLFPVLFAYCQRRGKLKHFQYFKEGYLAPIDGTQTFTSKSISCKNCCTKNADNPKKTTVFYHQLSAICLVKPGLKTVLPLMPEPITQQKDASKNDCEVRALERILEDLSREHYHLKLVLGLDGLYSKGPTLKLIRSYGHHFITVAKDSDHEALLEAVDDLDREGKVRRFTYTDKRGHRHSFRYVNDVPLNKSHPDFMVNYVDCVETDPDGKIKYCNSWVTSLPIHNHMCCMKIMRGGRARWLIENEMFNTLKNLGYNLEHNYLEHNYLEHNNGHGEENLASNFACLMFLAFLIDQIVELICPLFNEALKANKRKKIFWEKQRNFFEFFVVSSWVLFMKGLKLQGAPEPKPKGKRVKPSEQPKRKMVSIRRLFPDTA